MNGDACFPCTERGGADGRQGGEDFPDVIYFLAFLNIIVIKSYENF